METIEGDKVYYKQLVQPLLENLHRSISFGELGSVDSGNFFLCRHEDRIMGIQVQNKYVKQCNSKLNFFFITCIEAASVCISCDEL